MKGRKVYALGQDMHWLDAVAGIAGQDITVELVEFSGRCTGWLDRLPKADPKALVLVDATRQVDVGALAQSLHERGWRYIIVVAADPSSNEARAVLKGGIAYDYWEKSYVSRVIRRDIERCLREIQSTEE